MKLRYSLLLGLFAAISLVSCKKGTLKSSSSDFATIYNELIDNGKEEGFTWDAEVHSYTFVLNANRTLSSIGYQAHPDLGNTAYRIEILNVDDSTLVYAGDHIFLTNKVSYLTPDYGVSLDAGVTYTISRIQTNWGQYITETIGNVVKTDNSDYPVSSGEMMILETNFHDDGESSITWAKNMALPCIDIQLN